MIVPSNRLLAAAAVIALPSLTVGVAFTSAPILAIPLLLLLAAAADAVLGWRRLEGIAVDVARVTRMAEGRRDPIRVRLLADVRRALRIRIRLGLPEEVGSLQDEATIDVPGGKTSLIIDWRCLPHRRGRYALDACELSAPSPLALWGRRVVVPLAAEIRVYPDLGRERRLLLSGRYLQGHPGTHTQRQVGKGKEFEKLREYCPGDSYEDIHWKATAKRGFPVTKTYQIERTQRLYVIVDASRISARLVHGHSRSDGCSILDHFVRSSLVLAASAERQGDLFGLITFGDRVYDFVRAGAGKRTHMNCLAALYSLQPQICSPDYEELSTFIRLRLRRRSLIIFLTNLLEDPALSESFLANLEIFRRQHLVLIASLEQEFSRPLFSDPDVGGVEGIYSRLAGHIHWRTLRETRVKLRNRGVLFSEMRADRLSAGIVSLYMSIKKRQAL